MKLMDELPGNSSEYYGRMPEELLEEVSTSSWRNAQETPEQLLEELLEIFLRKYWTNSRKKPRVISRNSTETA